MIQTANNNFSVLPWYDNIKYQNHRRTYAYGQIYPLIVPMQYLVPFQLMRTTRTNGISYVRLHDKDGNLKADITQPMVESGLQIVRFAALGYDVIVFPANFPLNVSIAEGFHYLTMSDGAQIFYSEMFTVVRDVSCCLKIEWYDIDNMVCDAGQIVYRNPAFKNRLYLNTQLGKPEYPFEEEGENRDGYFFPEKQISVKTFKCTILASEFLCDVMRFIRMADYIHITDKYGRKYNCDTFLITPKWQTQGDLASVEIEFKTNTVVKKIGQGYIISNKGDFNNDFSIDFKVGEMQQRNVAITVYGSNISDSTSKVYFELSSYAGSNIYVQIKYTTELNPTQKSINTTIPNGATSHSFTLNERIATKVDATILSKGENDNTIYQIND